MCEPLFQIGRTPIKPVDVDLSQRLERRVCDRRSTDDMLARAHKDWQERRFSDRRDGKLQ